MREMLLNVLQQPDAPEALERLYRSDRAAFATALPGAVADAPDSVLLRAWTARLEPEDAVDMSLPGAHQAKSAAAFEIWLVVVLGVLAGLFIKLPDVFADTSWTFFSEDWFYPRNILLGPLGAMLLYLLHARGWQRPSSWISLGLFGGLAVWMNTLTDTDADPTMLACLHGPLLLWCLMGAAYTGGGWPSAEQRRGYVRFFGEMVVFSGLLLLGGGVLLGLTFGLFELLNVSVDWIWEWMLPLGFAAIPLVAAWAVLRHDSGARIMPLLARIFVPLFLVVLMGYLVRLAAHYSELFQERDTLLTYNILLLAVLGLAVFSLSGREQGIGRQRAGMVEWLLGALLVCTVLLDFVGLAAIGERIVNMGITPNRLAVLGSNLAVLGNLLALLWGYAKLLQGRAESAVLEQTTARYLPVYAVWTAVVTFVFPLVF